MILDDPWEGVGGRSPDDRLHFRSFPPPAAVPRKANAMRLLAGAIIALFSTAALAEGSSAGYGMGGLFARFDPVVSQYNQSGELFRIAGHCQSACTLFLGVKNVCVDRGAQLLFHAGHDKSKNILASATSHLMSAYNSQLRNYLTAGGYMNTLAFHTISGRDMIQKFGYRECPKK